jgi:hypothetical protein
MIRNPAKSGVAGKARFGLSFRGGAAGAGPGIQRKFLDSGFAVFDRAPE